MSSSSSPAPSPGRTLAEFFHREPGILLTLAYVFLSAVGMTYRYFLLEAFGVNVFDLYDVNDFLLSGLRDPALLGIVLISYLVFWFSLAYERWLSERRPNKPRSAWRSTVASVLCFVTWFAALALLYAQKSAQDISAGRGQRVSVTKSGKSDEFTLIAITGRFVVVYDSDTKLAEAISNEQVESITFLNPPSKASSPPPAPSDAG